MGLFRARCADCHGMDARGVRGPDITQVWASGRTDEGLFKTIKGGVPGTEMPAQPALFDHESVADPRLPPHAGGDRAQPIRRVATPRTARRSSGANAPAATA